MVSVVSGAMTEGDGVPMASEGGEALEITRDQALALTVLVAGVALETTPGVDCHKMASEAGAERGTIRAGGGVLTDSAVGVEPGITRASVACPMG
jgi:hypothetical protein